MPSLVEIDPMILERKIFNYSECFFAINFPWKRAWPFIWPIHVYKLSGPIPSPTSKIECDILYVFSLVEISSVVLEKKIFKFSQCTFAILLSSTLWKRPLGHIAHLRNHFKLMKTFVQSYYIITSIWRGENQSSPF